MDQLLEVGLALRCGDADAGTDAHDPGVEMRGGGDRLDDPLGDVRGCPAAGVAEQDGELVPPDACAQVPRAGGPAQAYCDLAEQLVTRSVTEGVVDVLEVVEVDEQDSRVLRGPVVEGARQCGVERRPVNQTVRLSSVACTVSSWCTSPLRSASATWFARLATETTASVDTLPGEPRSSHARPCWSCMSGSSMQAQEHGVPAAASSSTRLWTVWRPVPPSPPSTDRTVAGSVAGTPANPPVAPSTRSAAPSVTTFNTRNPGMAAQTRAYAAQAI